ncbi:MAG: hydroxyacid dehydrogenase [Chloroflexi bacterium]|nr:hydroxyacid dehydrogenase [Chloroflexota bacterium]
MKTILLDMPLHPQGLAILNAAGHEVIGPLPSDTPERRAIFARAHAIIIGSAWQINDETLAQSATVQVVGRPGIGIDNIDLADATKHGVCVVHTPDAPTQSTAEHAFSLLIALAKQTLRIDRDFHAKGWNSKNAVPLSIELKGKTLGLVGLGRIGGTIAKMARGFDMRVICFDPYVTAERAAQTGVELRPSLSDVLAEADFVSLHCALTPQTRGLIGPGELKTMKRTAYLVNCARGPVINEAALIDALRAGTIAGAGIDVFEEEPTPAGNPLLALDNVVLSPHVASRTEDGVYQMSVGAAEEVCAVLRGEPPRWLANREVWAKRRA